MVTPKYNLDRRALRLVFLSDTSPALLAFAAIFVEPHTPKSLLNCFPWKQIITNKLNNCSTLECGVGCHRATGAWGVSFEPVSILGEMLQLAFDGIIIIKMN